MAAGSARNTEYTFFYVHITYAVSFPYREIALLDSAHQKCITNNPAGVPSTTGDTATKAQVKDST